MKTTIHLLALMLMTTDTVLGDCTAPGGICCNVCGNHADGEILNPNHEFFMIDTINGQPPIRWTCGRLELALADVNAGETGAAGEARYCALATFWARSECDCSGPPPPQTEVSDPNAACDLCGAINGQSPQLNFVPGVRQDELVDTQVAGPFPCGTLYTALAEERLNATLCPVMQQNVGAICCSAPPLDPVPPTGGSPQNSEEEESEEEESEEEEGGEEEGGEEEGGEEDESTEEAENSDE